MMDTSTAPRTELHYCIDGLPAREELVFKSLVRMLEHRTHHCWRYTPRSSELLVIGESVSRQAIQMRQPAPLQVLTLGVSAKRHDWYLPLPLRASDLESELNRMGAVLALEVQRAVETPVDRLSIQTTVVPPVLANSSFDEDIETADHLRIPFSMPSRAPFETNLVRLLRWPPASLIETTTHMRLATLLTGQPVSLVMLSARSKVPLADCYGFLTDLHRVKLLSYSQFPPVPVADMERRSPVSSKDAPTVDVAMVSSPKPSLSLFERIRRRLSEGLGSSSKVQP